MSDTMNGRQVNRRAMKAAIEQGTLTGGGRLNQQQFDEFFQEVVDVPQLLPRVRTVPMAGPEHKIDKIGVGERLLRSTTEGQEGTLVDVDHGEVEMSAEEVEIPFTISRQYAEDNIEGEDVTDVIMDLFGRQFAVDNEDLGSIGGDPEGNLTGDDATFAGINDGWIATADAEGSTTVDHQNATVDKSVFQNLRTALPDKYRRGDRELAFITSMTVKDDYQEYLSDRSTASGDAMLMRGDEPTPWGNEIITPVGWPDSRIMLVQPQNLIWAIWRDVNLDVTTEGSKKVLERLWGIGNFTARTDYAIEDIDGVVTAENVATSG